jgi:hypothetical protein
MLHSRPTPTRRKKAAEKYRLVKPGLSCRAPSASEDDVAPGSRCVGTAAMVPRESDGGLDQDQFAAEGCLMAFSFRDRNSVSYTRSSRVSRYIAHCHSGAHKQQ